MLIIKVVLTMKKTKIKKSFFVTALVLVFLSIRSDQTILFPILVPYT
jgi:hypothetical protein